MTVLIDGLTAEQYAKLYIGTKCNDMGSLVSARTGIEYKGYIIEPMIMSFDIRYAVFGEGFVFKKYKTIEDAKRDIDKYLAQKYVNNLLEQISFDAGISKEMMLETLKEMLIEVK